MNAKITYSLLSSTDIKSCTFNLSPEKNSTLKTNMQILSVAWQGERGRTAPGGNQEGTAK